MTNETQPFDPETYRYDDNIHVYDPPCADWTPTRRANWDAHMADEYEQLETDAARYWYRRCYRPKMRGSGKMQRDHVKLGTPEDYIVEHVDDCLSPMGDLTSLMLRRVSSLIVDTDVLDAVAEEIAHVRLQQIAANDPSRAERLLEESRHVASLYGV